jgi:spermidine/putrescine transport system substrate-binding protein
VALLMLLTLLLIVIAAKLSPTLLRSTGNPDHADLPLAHRRLRRRDGHAARVHAARRRTRLHRTTGTTTSPRNDQTLRRCASATRQTYYSDNEAAREARRERQGYDVLVPTSNAVQALIRGGQLTARQSGADEEHRRRLPEYTVEQPVPVQYAMSTTIIGYNDEKMKDSGCRPTRGRLSSTKYLEKVKGRVTVLDSERLFAAAQGHLLGERRRSQALGRSRGVKKAKPYWAAFNASSYIKFDRRQHLARARLLERHLPGEPTRRRPVASFLRGVPKEGRARRHNMVIHKSAPRPTSLRFINFMLEGRNSAELTNVGSGNPNAD